MDFYYLEQTFFLNKLKRNFKKKIAKSIFIMHTYKTVQMFLIPAQCTH